MLLAGFFATVLFLVLIVGDWSYFVRLTPDAVRYGCSVGRSRDHWPRSTPATVRDRFAKNGVLMLPHGVARLYPELSQIAIRPQYRLFSMSFRTAWPVKGLIHLSTDDRSLGTLCVKRIPWSSALLTVVWFAVVSIGSLIFVVTYAMEGGFASFRGVLLGAGMIGFALVVLALGLMTVILSYRLENGRLAKVYEELREAIDGSGPSEIGAPSR